MTHYTFYTHVEEFQRFFLPINPCNREKRRFREIFRALFVGLLRPSYWAFWLSNIVRFVDWLQMRSSSYHMCVQMIVWILNDKERSGQSLNLGMSEESLKWRLLVLIFTSWLKMGLMTDEVVSTATVQGTISMINIL